MSNKCEKNSSHHKRAAAQITKFNYHLENTIPEHFSQEILQMIPSTLPKIISKKGIRGMTFYFVDHLTQGVDIIDAESILLNSKKIYLTKDSMKINDNMYTNYKVLKAPFLPIYGEFHEMIEFCIIDKSEERTLMLQPRILNAKNAKSDHGESQLTIPKVYPKKKQNNFQLYVIHHCHLQKAGSENHMQWENFIQKYHFKEQRIGNQVKHVIKYNLLLNNQQDQGFLSYFSYKDRLFQQYLDEHVKIKDEQLQNINLFQGYLLQSKDTISKKLEVLNDPAFDQSQKKWLKLSPQHYKMFNNLKKYALTEHKRLYGSKEHLSQTSINSLVHRYMVAKEFHFKEIHDCIIDYLKWQKTLSQSYNLVMFQKFHNLDFFTYLGNDYQGRAVVLNKASKLIIEKIDSVEDYCNYYCYYFEVFIPRKLRGYADQFIALADLQDLSSANFKLSITKQNASDGLKYGPQRQFKFIVFNAAGFATALWSIFKIILPKRTLSKINILGTDKNEILDFLLGEMDISVIPEYLGGNNKRTYKDDLKDEQQYLTKRK